MATADKTTLRERPSNNENVMEMWVKRVIRFSSEYDTNRWCATMIIGAPQVYPDYGDKPGAWAQGVINESQYIEVEFEEKVYVDKIDIYETLNAGAVVKVSALSDNGQWVPLWQVDRPTLIQSSRIFSPIIETRDFYTNSLRLDVNCSAIGSWCEIDAIKLTGRLSRSVEDHWGQPLANDLNELVNSSQFSDVAFNVGGERIVAHKAILVSRSQYFRAMFTNSLRETYSGRDETIVIEGVSAVGFLAMIRYLYTGTIDTSVTPLTLVELIRAADRFNLKGLRALSVHFLGKDLNADNVVDVYLEATDKLPELENIQELCTNFMSKNMANVVKTKSFCDLSQITLLTIIQRTANLRIN